MQKPNFNRMLILELAIAAIMLVAPLAANYFWQLLLTKILILGLVALSFDLVWGYSGVLSFGQAVFFGTAGYAAATLSRDYAISSAPLLIAVGMATGLGFSVIVGLLIFAGKRMPSQVFIAVATLSASYVIERVVRGWTYLGGQNGIPSLPRLTVGSWEIVEGIGFYYFAAVLLLVCYLGLRLLVRSQFGLVLVAVRDDEARASYFGYRTQYFKYLTFSLGGMIGGLAGTLYAFHEAFVGPSLVGPTFSTQIVLYSLFGGTGSLIGAVLGVGVVEIVGFYVTQIWDSGWPFIVGILLLLIVTIRPGGLVSLLVGRDPLTGPFGRISRNRKQLEHAGGTDANP